MWEMKKLLVTSNFFIFHIVSLSLCSAPKSVIVQELDISVRGSFLARTLSISTCQIIFIYKMSYNAGPADFVVNHQDYQNEDVIKIYDNWTNYEQAMLGEGYVGHIETVNLVSQYFPKTARKGVNIIDIGAGSGLVGLELRKQGFSYIDALEPCASLSQQARDRNVYNNYITESLSLENHCSISNDTYHCATAVACFSGTHIPSVLLVEVLRILKPGGLAFVTVRDLPENLDLVDVSKELETKGTLEIIQTYKFPRFRRGIPGLCYIFKKPELV